MPERLTHLQFPHTNAPVHIAHDERMTYCGRYYVSATRTYNGQPMPLAFEVTDPANCEPCRKGLLKQIRHEIHKWSLPELETLAHRL